ncbi:MAG: hypothetical protein DGJ47_000647 [Rickettsiaceae bacterium]
MDNELKNKLEKETKAEGCNYNIEEFIQGCTDQGISLKHLKRKPFFTDKNVKQGIKNGENLYEIARSFGSNNKNSNHMTIDKKIEEAQGKYSDFIKGNTIGDGVKIDSTLTKKSVDEDWEEITNHISKIKKFQKRNNEEDENINVFGLSKATDIYFFKLILRHIHHLKLLNYKRLNLKNQMGNKNYELYKLEVLRPLLKQFYNVRNKNHFNITMYSKETEADIINQYSVKEAGFEGRNIFQDLLVIRSEILPYLQISNLINEVKAIKSRKKYNGGIDYETKRTTAINLLSNVKTQLNETSIVNINVTSIVNEIDSSISKLKNLKLKPTELDGDDSKILVQLQILKENNNIIEVLESNQEKHIDEKLIVELIINELIPEPLEPILKKEIGSQGNLSKADRTISINELITGPLESILKKEVGSQGNLSKADRTISINDYPTVHSIASFFQEQNKLNEALEATTHSIASYFQEQNKLNEALEATTKICESYNSEDSINLKAREKIISEILGCIAIVGEFATKKVLCPKTRSLMSQEEQDKLIEIRKIANKIVKPKSLQFLGNSSIKIEECIKELEEIKKVLTSLKDDIEKLSLNNLDNIKEHYTEPQYYYSKEIRDELQSKTSENDNTQKNEKTFGELINEGSCPEELTSYFTSKKLSKKQAELKEKTVSEFIASVENNQNQFKLLAAVLNYINNNTKIKVTTETSFDFKTNKNKTKYSLVDENKKQITINKNFTDTLDSTKLSKTFGTILNEMPKLTEAEKSIVKHFTAKKGKKLSESKKNPERYDYKVFFRGI